MPPLDDGVKPAVRGVAPPPQKSLGGDSTSSREYAPVGPWQVLEKKVCTDGNGAGTSYKLEKRTVLSYGCLAVWRPPFRPEWRVELIPLNIHLGDYSTKADALKIGEYFMRRFGSALRCDTREEIREELPAWVIEWGKALIKAKKWVDPSEYEEED